MHTADETTAPGTDTGGAAFLVAPTTYDVLESKQPCLPDLFGSFEIPYCAGMFSARPPTDRMEAPATFVREGSPATHVSSFTLARDAGIGDLIYSAAVRP